MYRRDDTLYTIFLREREIYRVGDFILQINRKGNIDSRINEINTKYFTIIKLFQTNFKKKNRNFYASLLIPEQRLEEIDQTRRNLINHSRERARRISRRWETFHLASQRSTEMTEKAFEKCLGIVGKFYDRSCKPPARSAWRHLSRMFAKYPANPLNL